MCPTITQYLLCVWHCSYRTDRQDSSEGWHFTSLFTFCFKPSKREEKWQIMLQWERKVCYIGYELLSYNPGDCCAVLLKIWPSKLLHPVQLTKPCMPQRRIQKTKLTNILLLFKTKLQLEYPVQFCLLHFKKDLRKRKRTKGGQSKRPKGGWKVRQCGYCVDILTLVWKDKRMLLKLHGIIEVPSSLKVSVLGQIKGNSALYLWKLIPKSE